MGYPVQGRRDERRLLTYRSGGVWLGRETLQEHG